MSLIPSWPTVAIGLTVGALSGASGMHVWDASTIAAAKLNVATIKQQDAEKIATQSQTALKNLADAAKTVNEAAQSSQVDVTTLGNKLDTLARAYKNAKPTVLSADCRPGTVRVQNLAASAAAVDAASARPVAGK